MRTIKFKVHQQRIKNIDSVSFVYGGTDNYLQLKFEFGSDWDGCYKAISFISENEIAALLKDDCVLVPAEAFYNGKLSFYLVGKKKDYRIQTQQFDIKLGG